MSISMEALSLDTIQMVWCFVVTVSFLRTFPSLLRFYRWFNAAGLKISDHRGHGQTACRLYGVIPTFKLSVRQWILVAGVFVAVLATIPFAVYANMTPPTWQLEDQVALKAEMAESVHPVSDGLQKALQAEGTTYLLLCMLFTLALVCYHLYFSQLYCEAHVGGHVTVLLPPAIILLALYNLSQYEISSKRASARQGQEVVEGVQIEYASEIFFSFCMKLVVTSCYGAAGISKISSCLRSKRNWCNGSTLQACLFEALLLSNHRLPPSSRASMSHGDAQKGTNPNEGRGTNFLGLPHFSFGVPTPWSHKLQRYMLDKIFFLRMFSYLSVAIELFAPCALVFSFVDIRGVAGEHVAQPLLYFNCGVAFLGFSLHYGIAYMQNVDFLSWWVMPSYLFFVMDPLIRLCGGVDQDNGVFSTDASKVCFGDLSLGTQLVSFFPTYSAWFPISLALAVLYCTLHVGFCVVLALMDRECLPFSAFKMFSDIKDLFHPAFGKWLWLSDKPHETGSLKNYCFPFCRPHCVTRSELPRLPFKYLLIGHNGARRTKGSADHTPKPTGSWGGYFFPSPDSPLAAAGRGTDLSDKLLSCMKKGDVDVYSNLLISEPMWQSIQEIAYLGSLGEGAYAKRENIEALMTSMCRLREQFYEAEKVDMM